MPPQRRQREYESSVDPNARHVDDKALARFGDGHSMITHADRNALHERAARAEEQAERFKQQVEQLQEQLTTQSGDLALQDDGLIVQGFQFSPTGLIAPDNMTQEAWEQVGLMLFRLEGSIQWLIGDWLNYGEVAKWGETGEIAKVLGREPQTLYHYKSISLTFEFCRRRQNLSFGHHDAVRGLSIEEQDHALDQAEIQRLSVAAFRKILRGEEPAPALVAGDELDIDKLARDLKRFYKHRPSNATEKTQALSYIQMMRRYLDDLERDCK